VAPLPRTSDVATPTTGFDDVRSICLARLALETLPRVQVDWQVHGPKLAQVALTVGADDLDLVAASDNPSLGTRRAALAEVVRNIAAAALTPVERDGRFGRLPG
jgi:aminodeoxyfutalosine synthase